MITKYVCLRDDDTNFFTSVDDLRTAYGKILGQIPITFGVIPFIHGSSILMDSVDPLFIIKNDNNVSSIKKIIKNQYFNLNAKINQLTDKDISSFSSVYPIGFNKELTIFLKSLILENKIEIAQHGVFHRYNLHGPEMISKNISFSHIQEGMFYLEKLFHVKIKTFIPPSNTIDEKCALAVNKLGMNLFSSESIKFENKFNYILKYALYPNVMIRKIFLKFNKKKSILNLQHNFKSFSSFTFDPYKDYKAFTNMIKKNLDEKNFISVGTHYKVLLSDLVYKRNYHNFINSLANMNNVKFVTAKEYYNLISSL